MNKNNTHPQKNNFDEKIDCPICESKNFKILKKKTIVKKDLENSRYFFNSSSNHSLSQQLVECKYCELVYVNPRISSKLINDGYSYNEDKKFILQNNQRIETFKINLNRVLNLINYKNKKFSILDVGSAGGAFLKSIKDPLITCDGIEPNKWLVDQAKKKYSKISMFATTIENFNNNKKYELITYWDVFEHLTDINNEIFFVNKLLKKNGYLILNLPDYGSLHRKIMGFKWPFFLDVHLYYFNKKTIELFMKNNQFQFIDIIKHVQILKLGYIMERIINIFPYLKFLSFFVRLLNLENIKIKYNIGQNIYIFKKQ